MTARLCHFTGWTWDYIEECMTIPRVKALMRHWEKTPPLPVMIAAYLGIKPKQEAESVAHSGFANDFLDLPEFE